MRRLAQIQPQSLIHDWIDLTLDNAAHGRVQAHIYYSQVQPRHNLLKANIS